ncbi:TetR/AcrR family transcriptional regulator [Ferrovibrio xuzhouensis]|uniref:TetR/AcrR family transcriptional regulator n=1 Tax=Ferrovibrio xuzhouensis TaxID=1576914 RepID=A0ABV7VJQ5_9PROT
MTEKTKPPARRGRPRSLESEAAILQTAYRLAAGEGLGAASIDAIARDSQVSKMTIYKWWPSREALLIDAFLRQAAALLPLPDEGEPLAILRDHAAGYAKLLNEDFGRVQRAIIAECIATAGTAALFADRYLAARRQLGVALIRRGQAQGTIRSGVAAADLYDRIYGTLFYQSLFGWRAVTPRYARALVDSVLTGR